MINDTSMLISLCKHLINEKKLFRLNLLLHTSFGLPKLDDKQLTKFNI